MSASYFHLGKSYKYNWTRRLVSPVVFILMLYLNFGCASYTEETSAIRYSFNGGAYQKALELLEKSDVAKAEKNRLLYHMDKAMILDRLGQGAKARRLYIEADKIADELYTVSISKTAASFIVNDSTQDYEGEDYEKVAIHTQMALSFLGDQNLPSARVEAVKINNKLAEINSKYDKKNRYAEDAFARYLAGMIYEALGEKDDAIIDYRKALATYEGVYASSNFNSGAKPSSLIISLAKLLDYRDRNEDLAKLKKKYPKEVEIGRRRNKERQGELIVLHEVGQIAPKQSQDFIFPFGKQVIRFSYPVIGHVVGGYAKSGIETGSGVFHPAEGLQNMSAIARATLEDKRLRMMAKGAARLIAKGQLTEQAYRNFGVVGGLAANVFSAATETADTRSWALLPNRYLVTRIALDPGTHKIRIFNDGAQMRILQVKVLANEPVLLRANDLR